MRGCHPWEIECLRSQEIAVFDKKC
jgi:hypothetical protein